MRTSISGMVLCRVPIAEFSGTWFLPFCWRLSLWRDSFITFHRKATYITQEEATRTAAKVSALQVAHDSLVSEYTQLMSALHNLPVGNYITVGPAGTNQVQWQRVR